MILTVFYALVGSMALGILYDIADASGDNEAEENEAEEVDETPELPPSETPEIDTITGTPGADTLTASDDEVAFGGDGDDTMIAEGTGTVVGGAGNDMLTASANGEAIGSTGSDTLFGAGDSTLSGGFGSDIMTLTGNAFGGGEEGSDTLTASGTALAKGDAGSDTLILSDQSVGKGGLDDDFLAASGNATALGNGGADLILGVQNTELEGGDGDDTLAYQGSTIAAAHAYATGGEGADTFVVGLTGAEDILSDWTGADGLPAVDGAIFEITDFNAAEDTVLIDAFASADGDIAVISELTTTSNAANTRVDVMLTATNATGDEVGSLTVRFTNIVAADFDVETAIGFVTSTEDALAADAPDTFTVPITPQTLTEGDDTATITASTLLDAGAGNDNITWTEGVGGIVDLGDGNDTITAGEANVVIDAGAGDDAITTAGGAVIDPGTGTDAVTLNLTASTAPVTLAFSEEADTLTVNLAADAAVDYYQVTVVSSETVTDAGSGDPLSFNQTGTVYFLHKPAGTGLTQEGFLADFGGGTIMATVDLGLTTGVADGAGGFIVSDALNDSLNLTVNGTLADTLTIPLNTMTSSPST